MGLPEGKGQYIALAVGDIYNWVKVKSQNFMFGAPHGYLVGKYKAFGEKISTSMKINPGTLPRKIWNYNGKSIFLLFFKYWQERTI